MFARVHAGDERGVIDPGDRRIRDRHRLRHRAFGGELAQIRHDEMRILPDPGGEAVDADEDDDAVLGGDGLREDAGGEGEDEGEGEAEGFHGAEIIPGAPVHE